MYISIQFMGVNQLLAVSRWVHPQPRLAFLSAVNALNGGTSWKLLRMDVWHWDIRKDLLVLSREWMGMGVAGMNIDSYCGLFPHSLLSTSKLRHTKRHLLINGINGVITNLLFLLFLRSTTRKLLGNEVQVKRKINGGDIDWALGAATWSLKWVGLGKHLQETMVF